MARKPTFVPYDAGFWDDRDEACSHNIPIHAHCCKCWISPMNQEIQRRQPRKKAGRVK
jgi:hypothetical protein